MKKPAIAAAIGVLCAALIVAANACAATAGTTGATRAATARSATAKKAAAKSVANPVPEGSTKWACSENSAFFLSGDMKRDQVVTVHWAGKNYKLPREPTTTGADRFHDAATGLDLVVIPTKAMLFSDKNSSRLADECKTPEMVAGAPAPIQTEALKQRPALLQGH
ncbi:hypothetical protein DFQ30_002522 [Apophysomyces sp. BC1015]|nr:hypothetical protein DFQ30_002522 [Apophysomyces sp. BC1015]